MTRPEEKRQQGAEGEGGARSRFPLTVVVAVLVVAAMAILYPLIR